MKNLYRICACALALVSASCSNDTLDTGIGTGYVMRTPEKFREMVTMVPNGQTTTVTGSGAGGAFIAERAVILAAHRIARYETTWELWNEVYDWALENAYTIANAGTEGHGTSGTGDESKGWASTTRITRPVTGITWRDAVVWCNAYSELIGYEPVYYKADGVTVLRVSENNTAQAPQGIDTDADAAVILREKNGYRLPIEAEWEYAARGAVSAAADWNYTYAGGNTVADVAWFSDNATTEGGASYGAHPVGSKRGGAYTGANKAGLFDASGNAAEWCADWYNPIVSAMRPDGEGPGSPAHRVLRGGSWQSAAADCAVKTRAHAAPFQANIYTGFRVARTIQTDTEVTNSGDYPPLLTGTKWGWDSPWGVRLIDFTEDDRLRFTDTYYPGVVFDCNYTYNAALGTGNITGPSDAASGDFKLKDANRTMYFPQYMNFGHSVDYTRVEE